MKLLLALCLSLVFAFTSSLAGAGDNDKNTTTSVQSSQATTPQLNETINWLTIQEAEQLVKKNPKPVFIDIYTEWCGWCKKLDKTTFQNPDIAEYINENFYAVKLDAEMKQPVTVAGHEYKYITDGKRGTHELALALTNGQMSLPTMVVLNDKFVQMGIIPGYQEPVDMDAILHYFASGSYEKNIPWGIYQKNYRSRIKK